MFNKSEQRQLQLRINGEDYEVTAKSAATLLEVLREKLNFTGTKEACGLGDCGACTVLIDGKVAYACIMLAADARGKEITTIEGVAKDGKLDPIQKSILDHGGLQCGFCTPGKVLAAKALFNEYPVNEITTEVVKDALAGHLCRCTGYSKTVKAVVEAAKEIASGGGK